MRKGTIEIKCASCAAPRTISIHKPGRVHTSFFNLNCKSCGTTHLFNAKTEDGQVRVKLIESKGNQ